MIRNITNECILTPEVDEILEIDNNQFKRKISTNYNSLVFEGNLPVTIKKKKTIIYL